MAGMRQRGETIATVMMMMFCLLLCKNMMDAYRPKTWTVGGEFGWDTIIEQDTWARGKTFYAGDIFVFNYDYQITNVMAVNKTGYDTCIPNEGAKEYESGNDRIALHFGYNYFIGTYNKDDCAAGERLAVKALASPPSTSSIAPSSTD